MSAATRRRPPPRNTQAPSAHWGRAVRSILLSPRKGFGRALKLSRSGDGGRAETVVASLLSGLGGSYLVLMFLKGRALFGLSEVSANYEPWWAGLILLLIAAAVGGVITHVLFASAAVPVVRRVGKACTSRDLRTVWGLANFPVAFGFVVVLLLDILIAGRGAYAAVEEGDSLMTGWAVASGVIGLSLGAWSTFLFIQGLGVAGGLPPSRAILVVGVGIPCLILGAALGFVAVVGLVILVGVLIDIVQAVNK